MLLLPPKLQHVAPQKALAVDLDEFPIAHVSSLGLEVQRTAAPLPVGETGGSKGMGGDREGDHPPRRGREARAGLHNAASAAAEDRGYAVAGAPRRTHPSSREGRSPIALQIKKNWRALRAAPNPREGSLPQGRDPQGLGEPTAHVGATGE
jgi:hypothetical protein